MHSKPRANGTIPANRAWAGYESWEGDECSASRSRRTGARCHCRMSTCRSQQWPTTTCWEQEVVVCSGLHQRGWGMAVDCDLRVIVSCCLRRWSGVGGPLVGWQSATGLAVVGCCLHWWSGFASCRVSSRPLHAATDWDGKGGGQLRLAPMIWGWRAASRQQHAATDWDGKIGSLLLLAPIIRCWRVGSQPPSQGSGCKVQEGKGLTGTRSLWYGWIWSKGFSGEWFYTFSSDPGLCTCSAALER